VNSTLFVGSKQLIIFIWRNGLKIVLTDENGDCINTTSNVVYKEIF